MCQHPLPASKKELFSLIPILFNQSSKHLPGRSLRSLIPVHVTSFNVIDASTHQCQLHYQVLIEVILFRLHFLIMEASAHS